MLQLSAAVCGSLLDEGEGGGGQTILSLSHTRTGKDADVHAPMSLLQHTVHVPSLGQRRPGAPPTIFIHVSASPVTPTSTSTTPQTL